MTRTERIRHWSLFGRTLQATSPVTYRILSAVTLNCLTELERHSLWSEEAETTGEGTRFGVLDTSLLAVLQDTRLIQAHTFRNWVWTCFQERQRPRMEAKTDCCVSEKNHKGVQLEYTVGNKPF
jgi:hypothetical protein